MPPRYTIRQVVGTYRRKAFGTFNDDGSPRRPPYPPDAIVAFYGVLELAEEQPRRGHFESERLLRILLEGPSGKGRRFARQVPFLILQGDLVPVAGGGLDVEGWEILQEGDTTIADRVARFRNRQRADPAFHDPLTGAQRTALYRLRQRVFERDAFTCRYCGTTDSPREWLVAEHVQPDGPTTEENLVTACRSCNKLKGGRTPEGAGMALLSVPPRDADVTLQADVTSDVTSDGVTCDAVTVTPRTGDARPQRRGDGYQETETPIPPPSGGSPRSNGTNPRALAAEITRRANAAEAERKARRKARHVAYLDGRLTEAQRLEMDERDAPLEEIPAERGAAYQGATA